MVLYSIVVNTIISGLEAFVIREAEIERLESFVASRARSLITSGCVVRDEAGKVVDRWGNEQVLAWIGVAPIAVEIRIKRLRMLASIIREPRDARLPLEAVFGHYVNDIGCVTGARCVPTADPWLKQFAEDVRALQDCTRGCRVLGRNVRAVVGSGILTFCLTHPKPETISCRLMSLD